MKTDEIIYTSYFAKLRTISDKVFPIAICGKSPQAYTGKQYKKLAPKYGFFMEWKQTHDNDMYIRCFNKQVLDTLNAEQVVKELMALRGNNPLPICLLCYEKPEDFCHRHLVADWLNKNCFIVKEYGVQEGECPVKENSIAPTVKEEPVEQLTLF